MKEPGILKDVDRQKVICWLKLVGLPLLRPVSFFEAMGFPSWFVRQYFYKHRFVLQPGGRIQHEVRGVNEVGLLCGLAEAMGIDASTIAKKSSKFTRTRAIGRECLHVLENDGKEN